ncbi:hypothetical protein ABPG75_009455 [Micractinium tetrahymenae]
MCAAAATRRITACPPPAVWHCPLQKLNHFPGMLEIARKKALARNLAAMRWAQPLCPAPGAQPHAAAAAGRKCSLGGLARCFSCQPSRPSCALQLLPWPCPHRI